MDRLVVDRSKWAHRCSPATVLVGGILQREHVFRVPLDWADAQLHTVTDSTDGQIQDSLLFPGSPYIDVFVREVVKGRASQANEEAEQKEERKEKQNEKETLLFLQGGPGFPSPRPSAPPSGWLKKALEKGFRVLLLDQRGTGRSTAATPAKIAKLEAAEEGTARSVRFLSNLRADAIASDVECVRQWFCGEEGKISLLGQSYGGFVMLTYLSRFSDHVARCLFTCGLAPVLRGAADVYAATVQRMLARNRRFYARYPEDVKTVQQIVAHLADAEKREKGGGVILPSGGVLTVRRFQMLGLMLGSGSGMEALHWMLETAWEEPPRGEQKERLATGDGPELSTAFLHAVDAQQNAFETNPVYWVLHESIYCETGGASNWAAARAVADSGEFDAVGNAEKDLPVSFTGEMVFPWMGEDFNRLRPLQRVAAELAAKSWDRPLYDRQKLKNVAQRVPIAALVSYDDVYVERLFSEEVAELLGKEACKLWVTNEFQHSGLRDEGERVLETLLKMADNEISLPS